MDTTCELGGQREGTVRDDIDPHAVSAFIMAPAEGTFGRPKSTRSLDLIHSNLEVLVAYLENSRPERTHVRGAGPTHVR